MTQISLVGAGLAGCVLSIYLARRGFKVDIYERRPDPRKIPNSEGRSINLTLSTRGIHVLKQVGLYEKIMKVAIPLKGRVIHSINQELTFQPYGKKDHEVIYSMARDELNVALLNEVENYKNIVIHFNQKCTGIEFETRELKLRDEISGQQTRVKTNTVIGTDGSASALRMDMLKRKGFNFSQSYLNHGYKELKIPAGANNKFLLEKNALHVWPRGEYMINGFPNIDGSFTCILFAPLQGDNSFESLNSAEKVLNFFQAQFPDAVRIMPTLVEDYFSNWTGSLVTIKCNPWSVDERVLLLGDSAHAIVPFYGQGMNCAFEDCAYLDECIDKYGTDWQKVFQEFEKLRKVNTDAIADLSIENFTELREKISDSKFLLKKKVELLIAQKYPKVFISKYSLLAFHRIPYSEARLQGRIQDRILDELCESINEVEEVNWEKADELVKERLIKPKNRSEQFYPATFLHAGSAGVPIPAPM